MSSTGSCQLCVGLYFPPFMLNVPAVNFQEEEAQGQYQEEAGEGACSLKEDVESRQEQQGVQDPLSAGKGICWGETPPVRGTLSCSLGQAGLGSLLPKHLSVAARKREGAE